MAVTTPALFQPDGLTVTISQVPGVSLTLEAGRVEAWSMPGVLRLPHFLLFAFLGAPQQQASSITKYCCPPPKDCRKVTKQKPFYRLL